MSQLQVKWDTIYRDSPAVFMPTQVLVEHSALLPESAYALDLACGLGGNALFLAERGLAVDAWDISLQALTILQTAAKQRQLKINTKAIEISASSLPKQAYDIIVISRFLDRSLCNAIMAALKPQGLLFYQTFTRNKLASTGPSNPDYLLDSNELLRLFSSLTLVFYQEYARIGDLDTGNRNEACYIGQKT